MGSTRRCLGVGNVMDDSIRALKRCYTKPFLATLIWLILTVTSLMASLATPSAFGVLHEVFPGPPLRLCVAEPSEVELLLSF